MEDVVMDNSVDTDSIVFSIRFFWHPDDLGVSATHEELTEFLETWVHSGGDGSYMPRFMYIVRLIFDESIYLEQPDINPFNTHNPNASLEFDSKDFTLTIRIPSECVPEDMSQEGFIWAFKEFHDMLGDTLWDGVPGSGLIHDNGAVVDYVVT